MIKGHLFQLICICSRQMCSLYKLKEYVGHAHQSVHIFHLQNYWRN
jgi:hypothetical protein